MAKKTNGQQPATPKSDERPGFQMNWRWYWIRTALTTVLMFLFVLYLARSRGAIAYVWAGALSLATLGYFVYSYTKLRD